MSSCCSLVVWGMWRIWTLKCNSGTESAVSFNSKFIFFGIFILQMDTIRKMVHPTDSNILSNDKRFFLGSFLCLKCIRSSHIYHPGMLFESISIYQIFMLTIFEFGSGIRMVVTH